MAFSYPFKPALIVRVLSKLVVASFALSPIAASAAQQCNPCCACPQTQCSCPSQQGQPQASQPVQTIPQSLPPAPVVANGAVVYNPWYPGNVVPFFSAYPFVSTPYLIFDRAIPPPIPAPPPPLQMAQAPQRAAPVVPPDQPYAVAQPSLGYPN